MNPNADPCGAIEISDANFENIDIVRKKLKKTLTAGTLLTHELSGVEKLLRRYDSLRSQSVKSLRSGDHSGRN